MKKRASQGFTLTELMIAMAFLAFVLIFIVTAMVQYMGTYNKGLVYKEINQAGRTIFEDVTRSIRTSSANVRYMDEGRLCVGGQTYVWNTENPNTNNEYDAGSPADGEEIAGIIRVADSTGSLCTGGLPDIPQAGEIVVASPNVAVQSFTGRSADSGRLYSLALELSTSGANAPVNIAGNIQCAPDRSGDFCAVASFETNITTRN